MACKHCRARAYAMTGDLHESEPFCAYDPPHWAQLIAQGKVQGDEDCFAARFRTVGELTVA